MVLVLASHSHATVFGKDDRQKQEDFGNKDNLEAQKILGLHEIARSLSGIVPIEAYWGPLQDGTYGETKANGILACDRSTIILNAHSLRSELCEETKIPFTVQVADTPLYPDRTGAIKPKQSQILSKEVCTGYKFGDLDNDIAVLHLEWPLKRRPLKLGIASAEQLKGRSVVHVEANVSTNSPFPGSETEKAFSTATLYEPAGRSMMKTDADTGDGSSGSPYMVNQDGEILALGILQGYHSPKTRLGEPIDNLEYGDNYNFNRVIIFSPEIKDFLKKNIKHWKSCFRQVKPETESP
jgi:hypothetical protein